LYTVKLYRRDSVPLINSWTFNGNKNALEDRRCLRDEKEGAKMRKFLIFGFIMVTTCFWCPSSMAKEKSDNYSVGESQGTYNPPPQPPPKKCRQVCRPEYNNCTADCFRGGILEMGGCLGKCGYENCKTVCE